MATSEISYTIPITRIPFFPWPQSDAQRTFPPLLKPHLPHSNPLYNRILSPLNHPSRHCLFAATFPPFTAPPPNFTILFSDRSRPSESQIWIFNPLICSPDLQPAAERVLRDNILSLLYFLRDFEIPQAPGWPFSPLLRLAQVHEHITRVLVPFATAHDALVRISSWNFLAINLSKLPAPFPLPTEFSFSAVPAEQLDIVLSTSTIPRQRDTMLRLPNRGVLDSGGRLVAWGFVGVDASFATLYVLEAYRGLGLATAVAVELLGRLRDGEWAEVVGKGEGWEVRALDGESGWVQSDVAVGNEASARVVRKLGGVRYFESSYICVDTSKLP